MAAKTLVAVEMAAAEAESESGMSEYELQRLAHIRRNQECLARLGLADASFMAILNPGAAKKEKKPRAPRPKPQPVDESQCRRSLRAKGGHARVHWAADRHVFRCRSARGRRLGRR
eukprot:COSAG06_NODE_12834_length_1323_cov_1.531046_2_plen_115_part_01